VYQQVLLIFAVLLVVFNLLGFNYYQKNQDRQAYYACLKLSEKIINEKNTNTGSTQFLSLPYCRL